LTPAGVDAVLSLDSGRRVPADVSAVVRSVSAVGEQYVDLVPPQSGSGSGAGILGTGAVIPVERTSVPLAVGPLLDQADRMLSGLSDSRWRAVVDEAFAVFDGSGPDLARLLDSVHLFVQAAQDDVGPTAALIDQVGSLLDTQRVDAAAIRAWTGNLARFTDELRAEDPQLRRLINTSPDTIGVADRLFQQLHPTLPIVLANLVSVGQVSDLYLPNVEQILVVFPPLIRAQETALGSGPAEYGAMTDFMVQFEDPPPCTTGFLPATQWRSPARTDAPPMPNNLFCKVPQDSPLVVRGLRNAPCENDPGKREPTPDLCRGIGSYIPQGGNPWNMAPLPPDTGLLPHTAARPYDPQTGTFLGPDGHAYTQPGLGPGGAAAPPKDWKTMMMYQQGK
jgi:phospholipid/cholesterol/gamma-HCH transport system substrate-binding protein